MHELTSTSRMVRPPRIDPPASARESLADPPPPDAPSPMPFGTRGVGSEGSRAVAAEAPVSARAAVPDTNKTVRDIFKAFEEVEGEFYAHLTPEERQRIRVATCLPSQRTIHAHPVSAITTSSIAAILIGFMAGLVLRGSPGVYRGPSSTARRAVDTLVGYV